MKKTEANSGYVYLMRNKSMPSMVKIGFTRDNPRKRAKELSKPTGIPEPFEVVGEVTTPWPSDVEAEVHRQLSFLRVTKGREFFTADISKDLFMASHDEMNKYFMLIIRCAAEEIAIQKQREALDKEWWELLQRNESKRMKFLFECMKKNYPKRAEEIRQRMKA